MTVWPRSVFDNLYVTMTSSPMQYLDLVVRVTLRSRSEARYKFFFLHIWKSQKRKTTWAYLSSHYRFLEKRSNLHGQLNSERIDKSCPSRKEIRLRISQYIQVRFRKHLVLAQKHKRCKKLSSKYCNLRSETRRKSTD